MLTLNDWADVIQRILPSIDVAEFTAKFSAVKHARSMSAKSFCVYIIKACGYRIVNEFSAVIFEKRINWSPAVSLDEYEMADMIIAALRVVDSQPECFMQTSLHERLVRSCRGRLISDLSGEDTLVTHPWRSGFKLAESESSVSIASTPVPTGLGSIISYHALHLVLSAYNYMQLIDMGDKRSDTVRMARLICAAINWLPINLDLVHEELDKVGRDIPTNPDNYKSSSELEIKLEAALTRCDFLADSLCFLYGMAHIDSSWVLLEHPDIERDQVVEMLQNEDTPACDVLPLLKFLREHYEGCTSSYITDDEDGRICVHIMGDEPEVADAR